MQNDLVKHTVVLIEAIKFQWKLYRNYMHKKLTSKYYNLQTE